MLIGKEFEIVGERQHPCCGQWNLSVFAINFKQILPFELNILADTVSHDIARIFIGRGHGTNHVIFSRILVVAELVATFRLVKFWCLVNIKLSEIDFDWCFEFAVWRNNGNGVFVASQFEVISKGSDTRCGERDFSALAVYFEQIFTFELNVRADAIGHYITRVYISGSHCTDDIIICGIFVIAKLVAAFRLIIKLWGFVYIELVKGHHYLGDVGTVTRLSNNDVIVKPTFIFKIVGKCRSTRFGQGNLACIWINIEVIR